MLSSARGQSYTDWEMLIGGEGCTDDSAEIVERARAHDERIRWVSLREGEQSAVHLETKFISF